MDLEKGAFQPIPGYLDYEINHIGEVRRLWLRRPPTIMTLVLRRRSYVVRLTARDGKRQEKHVHKLMQLAFFPPVKPGQVFYHKNGNRQDNWINNLGYITLEELGKKTGGSARRRAVKKLTPAKEVVEIYKSAREAARRNYMSHQTVIGHCNGDMKRKIAPDGFVYRWEERKQT